MQVPIVTLEDLQAFQYKHFPGQSQPPFLQDDQIPDEDLGYYPDGVKRTLTDEQIEMFRHSEIHALLRKKQLEQENADYEARMCLPAEDTPEGNPKAVHGKRSLDTEASPSGNHKRSVPQRGSRQNNVDDTTSEPLDYGDESSGPLPAEKPPRSQASYQGRRIISYDD